MSVVNLLWSLRRAGRVALRRLGWGGVLVAVLVPVLLAMAALEGQLRQSAQAAAGEARLDASQRLSQARLPTGGPRSLDQELDAFDAKLPPVDEAMQVLGDLFLLAEKHQLVLARGEYRLQPDKAGGFVRLKMSLPVKGDARVVQRFVNEALRAHPSLAFDALALKRDRIDAGTVEARVQWSLLMRGPREPGARPAVRVQRQPES